MLGTTNSKNTRPGGRLWRWAWCGPALAIGAAAAPTAAGATSTRPVVTTATIPGIGSVLVAGHRPVYLFTHDRAGKSSCTGKCALVFPPLLVTKSKAHHLGTLRGLKTVRRSNGRLQVAFHGHPLYLYAGDHSLSTASGQGLAMSWWTIRPSGAVVHTVAVPRAQAPASTSTSSPAVTSIPSGNSTSSGGTRGTAPTSPTSPTVAPSPATTTPTVASNPAPTTPPPPRPTTTTTSPPPTTTTTEASGGGVSF